MKAKDILRDILPNKLHCLLITLYNFRQYRVRHGGQYANYKSMYHNSFHWDVEKLIEFNQLELKLLLNHAKQRSPFYSDCDITNGLSGFPLLEKDTLRTYLEKIKTIDDHEGVVNFTGGTTGASLRNVFSHEDVQKRHAFLDAFRERCGYVFGSETAWFSGKEILSKNNLKKGIISKRDFVNRINYYSTFHISDGNIESYVLSLNNQKPKFLVGFPSSMAEIAKLANKKGLSLDFKVISIFPTAEKVTDQHRNDITSFFGGKVYDQYASSEGAPFIVECSEGKLHLQLQTGCFEFLDIDNNDVGKELVVTSFSTYGTPLIRYKIGDTVELSSCESCICGDSNPIISSIGGRIDDFIYDINGAKVNLGNLSNCTKNVVGISNFQIVQNELSSVTVNMVVDDSFDSKQVDLFRQNLTYRLGDRMNIKLAYVDSIPLAKSGKFRLVVNNIK
ncbi:hypothetical protein AYI72_01020 [Shewanella algae]|uniref:phenylacetate--CoA ligase family protein n=1 Tax=Shewanella algae TaxID=38313 RepID=UPI001182C14F|nr:phenylacetate--CoA ligase family protein [Shewanella algae]TVL09944.1 hypothetical protein AYI72_01020 [Shewanella algae]